MNYETGEILASVSQPVFDPNYMADYLAGKKELKDGAMVNRATMGRYTPGSTFKTVTLLAALRYLPNADRWTYDCTGELVFDRDSGRYLAGIHADDEEKYSYVRDSNHEQHGTITLKEAYAKSCNCAFASLAMQIGPAKLKKTAQALGVDENYTFADIMTYSGSFEEGARDIDIAWSGAGQYKDLVTPVNMCLITSAVANGGVMMEPKLLKSVEDSSGKTTYTMKSNAIARVMSTAEAKTVREYMTEVVVSGTGSRAAVSDYTVGGKTGTAQVSDSGAKENTAWFTGFVDDPEHPLAICVVLEEAGTGGRYAAPIAAKMFQKAIALGY